MKYFALAALLASANALKIGRIEDPATVPVPVALDDDDEKKEVKPLSWDPSTLPACPGNDRTLMDDGKTHVTKYPFVGATCVAQLSAPSSSMLLQDDKKEPVSWDKDTLPNCPGNERTILDDGKTHAVKYPYVGATCQNQMTKPADSDLIFTTEAVDPWKLQHCPDFDERHTLVDGKTRAIPYPEAGYNCHKEWALNQQPVPAVAGLEHCPDFDERHTLVDGVTWAVPYPQTGYNCNNYW